MPQGVAGLAAAAYGAAGTGPGAGPGTGAGAGAGAGAGTGIGVAVRGPSPSARDEGTRSSPSPVQGGPVCGSVDSGWPVSQFDSMPPPARQFVLLVCSRKEE